MMKMLVVNRKITVSILMMLVLICGLSGVSYGQEAVTIENPQCSGVRRAWPLETWVDVTIQGSVRATQDVRNLRLTGKANGKFVGLKFLGELSAGESEDFSITGFIVTNENNLNCGVEWEGTVFRQPNPPATDPTPAQPPAETSNVCRVGAVLSPGQSCIDPGTEDTFSVLANGSGRYLFITAGTRINLRGNINGKQRNFVAEKRADGKWEIKSITGGGGPQTPIQEPEPDREPDLVVTSVRASDTTVSPGERFTLSATVRNRGTGDATATTLRYYRSTDNRISANDTQVGTDRVSALETNRIGDESISLTAPTTPGTYYYGACVDTITDESHTGNNCSRAVRVTVNPPEVTRPQEDVNADGTVDIDDLVYVAYRYGQTGRNRADVNGDNVVNIDDLILVAAVLDADAAAAPSLHPATLEGLTVKDVQLWLSQARQRDLTDPSVRRGLLFLEQLLASMVPKETALLTNYPNPFNPETWIPYHLATDADVTLTIYDVRGVTVRELTLGHQAAGAYENRGRAAYWDGRNQLGEPVTSGVYFYTLTAGDFTATRKLLIIK